MNVNKLLKKHNIVIVKDTPVTLSLELIRDFAAAQPSQGDAVAITLSSAWVTQQLGKQLFPKDDGIIRSCWDFVRSDRLYLDKFGEPRESREDLAHIDPHYAQRINSVIDDELGEPDIETLSWAEIVEILDTDLPEELDTIRKRILLEQTLPQTKLIDES